MKSPLEVIMRLALQSHPARWDRDSLLEEQVDLGAYTVDFLLVDVVHGVQLAIECDGHTYHERTPEQATHDRSRDRALLLLTPPVYTIRFTTLELTSSPESCAGEAYRVLGRLISDRARAWLDGNRTGFDSGLDRGFVNGVAHWNEAMSVGDLGTEEHW